MSQRNYSGWLNDSNDLKSLSEIDSLTGEEIFNQEYMVKPSKESASQKYMLKASTLKSREAERQEIRKAFERKDLEQKAIQKAQREQNENWGAFG